MSKNQQNQAQFPRRFGNYHLLAPLAQGGMGALYLAVRGDRGLERLLVIKTVLPHLADEEYLARFRDEAKVVVKLSHGNLIPVFDAGQVGGEVFLAMEFVEGRDLRAVWNRCAKKQVAFPVEVAVYVVKELCRGLSYAHAFGGLKLVHRDVSPPNVLISFSGEVKLTDFGLASSTLKLEKTAPGIIYGKVAYMSPEQARGEELDGRSDLYAAAIVLWEMLTGRQLFPPGKDQPQDLIKRARNPRVPAPSARAPRVPHELDEICLKALGARSEDRYQDCEEFREALAVWLADTHPGTDASRLESFLHKLFAEDIERERREREELLDKIRKRAETMPPSDELRLAIERSGEVVAESVRRSSGSVGRRSTDHGLTEKDRRQISDRRLQRAQSGRPLLTQPGHGPMRAPSSDGISASSSGALMQSGEPPDVNAVIGQVIDGRYRVSELIGEGGMGRVYLAEHVEIGRRVAMKILHPVYSHMPDLVERFRREARAASRIGHPHIVDVTDSGRTREGSVYFVMEFLDGVDLGTVIERQGSLDVRRALRIITQICRALAAAHEAGIIHRDLKPENIFLTLRDGEEDFVKVLDFGIAKSTQAERASSRRLTSPGMAMGTPEYMAPEQAAGHSADERCDIYAVGAILYEALVGKPPYDGDNFMEVLTKKATTEPTPIDELRPEVPLEVISLVERAMSRKPEARPATMEVFAYELTKCMSGRGEAVANVLGMRTSRELMASLNPGLALPPPRPDSEPGRAGQLSLPPPRASSSDGLWSSLGADVEIADATLVESSPSPSPASEPRGNERAHRNTILTPVRIRSRWGFLGWIGAAVTSILAAGVILYIASADDPADSGGEVIAAAAPDAGSAAVAVAPPPPPPPPPPPAITGDAGQVAVVSPPAPDDADAAPLEMPPDQMTPPVRPQDPPAPEGLTRAEAKKLLSRARAKRISDPKGAIDLYQQASKSKPYRRQAFIGMAQVAFDRKDWDGAISYARRAGGSQASRILADAYFRKGDKENARRYYNEVLERNPNDSTVKAILQRIGP